MHLSTVLKKVLLYRQSIYLSALTMGSYLLGFVRDKVFAHYYGLSSTIDVYHASFIIPDTIMNLFLAGAMVSVLVPFFHTFKPEQKKERNEVLTIVLSAALIINIIVCVVVFFLMPWIIGSVTPAEQLQSEVLFYSRFLLISPLIFLVSNFLGGVLVAKRNLLFYGLAPIMYNGGIIIGAVIGHDSGVTGMVIGALTGALLHGTIRFAGIWRNRNETFNLTKRSQELRTYKSQLLSFWYLAWPKMISLTVLHINYWLFTNYASRSGVEGSIFALNLARNFYNVPISVIVLSLATDAFASLSKSFGENDMASFIKTLKQYFVLILCAGIGFGILYFFLSPLFLHLLIKGGKFSEEAVTFSGTLLSYFGLVILFESLMQLLARVLHAMRDTFWQMISQGVCLVVTYLLLSFLFYSIGIIAIPVSFSIGMLAQNIIQVLIIRKKLAAGFTGTGAQG